MILHERQDKGRLMNVEDVADMLNVSVKTIYGWVYAKRIPHVKPLRAPLPSRGYS